MLLISLASTPGLIVLFCAADLKSVHHCHLGLRGLYIGPFGARAGKAEMTLEAVVTFGGEDEDGQDDSDDEDEDIDDDEVPLMRYQFIRYLVPIHQV